jgi:hypothetical protein
MLRYLSSLPALDDDELWKLSLVILLWHTYLTDQKDLWTERREEVSKEHYGAFWKEWQLIIKPPKWRLCILANIA